MQHTGKPVDVKNCSVKKLYEKILLGLFRNRENDIIKLGKSNEVCECVE